MWKKMMFMWEKMMMIEEMDSKATAVISSVIYGKDNAEDDKTGQ